MTALYKCFDNALIHQGFRGGVFEAGRVETPRVSPVHPWMPHDIREFDAIQFLRFQKSSKKVSAI